MFAESLETRYSIFKRKRFVTIREMVCMVHTIVTIKYRNGPTITLVRGVRGS
jgi:hypothetical protein